jgi:transposase
MRHDAQIPPQDGLDGFPVLRRDAAAVDVGSEQHWACAPGRTGGRDVRTFAATTPGIDAMIAWLQERRVATVALESTGVYWIAPHELLERAGFEVILTDTRAMRRVAGRPKTDRRDCEWSQRLHSCGLLRPAFRPPAQVCMLRTLVRDKATLVAERSDWVRRMQKALDQMNVRVHRAVSDLDGVTGLRIVRAIVAGERDPVRLATLRDPHCRRSEAEIAAELTGHWREDHLFSLQQAVKMYDALTANIAEYEHEIVRQLTARTPEDDRHRPVPPPTNRNKADGIKARGEDPLRQAWARMTGVDLTTIDAIGVETVSVALTEYGCDLTAFPTEKHFVSHLRLAPQQAHSGGKPVKNRRRPLTGTARLTNALRMAALSMRRSRTALGAYFRQIAQRHGRDVAVMATARKLAQYIYRLLRWGQAYVDEGAAAYEQRYHEARVKRLAATATQLGYTLVSVDA